MAPTLEQITAAFADLSMTVGMNGANWRQTLSDEIFGSYGGTGAGDDQLMDLARQAQMGTLPPLPEVVNTFEKAVNAGANFGEATDHAIMVAEKDTVNYLNETLKSDFVPQRKTAAEAAAEAMIKQHPELTLSDTLLLPSDYQLRAESFPISEAGAAYPSRPVSALEQFQLAEANVENASKAAHEAYAKAFDTTVRDIKMATGEIKDIVASEVVIEDLVEAYDPAHKFREEDAPDDYTPLTLTPGETYALILAAKNEWQFQGTLYTHEEASDIALKDLIYFYTYSPDGIKEWESMQLPEGWDYRRYAANKVIEWGGIATLDGIEITMEGGVPTERVHPLAPVGTDSLRGFISQVEAGDRGLGVPAEFSPGVSYQTSAWNNYLTGAHPRVLSASPQAQHLHAARSMLGNWADTAAGEKAINDGYRNDIGNFILTVAMGEKWNPLEMSTGTDAQKRRSEENDIMFYDWSTDRLTAGKRGIPPDEAEKATMMENWKKIAEASRDWHGLAVKSENTPQSLSRAEMIASSPYLTNAAAIAVMGGEVGQGPSIAQRRISWDRILKNHIETQLNLTTDKQVGLAYTLSQLKGSRWYVGDIGTSDRPDPFNNRDDIPPTEDDFLGAGGAYPSSGYTGSGGTWGTGVVEP